MKRFWIFLKKTWWLLLVLFSPPVIVITIFAVLEYCLGKIDMTAGEWSQLLAGGFGYWGTVILGVLAFWQNEQVQENNDILTRYERRKMSPIFVVSIEDFRGMLQEICIGIENISDNIACSLSISPITLTFQGEIKCPIILQSKQGYLNAHEKLTFTFATPSVSIVGDQVAVYSFSIRSTDIIGFTKETLVTIKENSHFQPTITYELNDIEPHSKCS